MTKTYKNRSVKDFDAEKKPKHFLVFADVLNDKERPQLKCNYCKHTSFSDQAMYKHKSECHDNIEDELLKEIERLTGDIDIYKSKIED